MARTMTVGRRARISVATLASGLALGLGAPGLAHMPYVLPTLFDAAGRDRITIEAAFTEDAFRPELAMRDAPFEVTGPDGRTVKLSGALLTRDRTVIEAALPTEGLYRVSSGQRLGRMNRMFRRDGQWVPVDEGETPPPGATLADVRSTTLADAYVLRGKPGATGALKPRGAGLEIQPLTDPAGIAPGAVSRLAILFDGRPLAGAPLTLFREAGFYDGRKQTELTSDAAGRVAITPADAGRYLLLVRHRPDRPGPTGGPALSYTATLAFEAQ